jgi:phosphatidylinositol phospholipase C delta
MKLREFSNMISSDLLYLYNHEKLSTPVNLNRPLCDYIINSTHNTYISGHQLVGKSNVEMYGFAMLEGYRLVELDCYDGKGEEIVITHGYTLVNKLKLVDILKELKNTAFVNSDLPVILSIENHCDKYHQGIMAKKCQEILEDVYAFPSENLPDFLPTLGELKRKFILKTSGKRVPGETIKNEPKRKPVETLNLVKNKMKLLKFKTKKSDENDNSLNVKKINKSEEKIKVLFSIKDQKNVNIKNSDEEKNEEDENDDEDKVEVINELEKLRGLHGTKFKIKQIDELKYQPWEFVTLKSDKIIKYSKKFETRKQLILFNQHCLMKAYPQKFDSSNYDVIKCWSTGCQCAAINIQATDDDFTLYDKIFFKQNQNKGYVLKPEKLLPNKDMQFENYLEPHKKINLKIISAFNIVKLINISKIKIKKDKQINIEIYTLDSIEKKDDDKFVIKLSGGVIFPKIEETYSLKSFDVYDSDFGCIMIKIKYDDKLVGRGCIPFSFHNEGYRKIPLYDNNCKKNQDSFLIGFISDN